MRTPPASSFAFSAIALLCAAGAARAQVSTWLGFPGFGGSGGWAGPANWSPTGVPNAPTADVFVSLAPGAPYTVSMNIPTVTLGRLTISSPDATVLLPGSTTLVVRGLGPTSAPAELPIAGTLQLGTPSFPGPVTLMLSRDTRLSGLGKTVLGPTGAASQASIAGPSGVNLIVDEGHTLEGTGTISTRLTVFGGSVVAKGGRLVFPPQVFNYGTIEGQAAGISAPGELDLRGCSVTGPGTIRNAPGNPPARLDGGSVAQGFMEGTFSIGPGSSGGLALGQVRAGAEVLVGGTFLISESSLGGSLVGVSPGLATVTTNAPTGGGGAIVARQGVLRLLSNPGVSGLILGSEPTGLSLAWDSDAAANACTFIGVTSVGLFSRATLRATDTGRVEGILRPLPLGSVVFDRPSPDYDYPAVLAGPGWIDLDGGAARRGNASSATIMCGLSGHGALDGLVLAGEVSPSQFFQPTGEIAIERTVELGLSSVFTCDLMDDQPALATGHSTSDLLSGGPGSQLQILGIVRARFSGPPPTQPRSWEIVRVGTLLVHQTATIQLPPPPDGLRWEQEIGPDRIVLRLIPAASAVCPADFNADGVVDPDDLSDFIGCFFGLPQCAAADANHDGVVDPDDLSDFIAGFFAGC